MAKTELEDRAFSDPRLKMAADHLKVGRGEILGYLAFIWHDSQQLGIEVATAAQIDSWIECSPRLKKAAIRAVLVEVGYLELLTGGGSDADRALTGGGVSRPGQEKFRIDGNSWRTTRVGVRITRAKTAARARWDKESNAVAPPKVPPKDDTSSMLEASPSGCLLHPNSMPDRETGRQVERITLPRSAADRVKASRAKLLFDPVDLELAAEWGAFAVEVSTTVKVDAEKWADAFRKLRTIDKVSPDDIRAMLKFVRDDAFWKPNAVSALALRERGRNGMMKHENIRSKMKLAIVESPVRRTGNRYIPETSEEERALDRLRDR